MLSACTHVSHLSTATLTKTSLMTSVILNDLFLLASSFFKYVCMYVWGVGHKIQPLHRDLQ
jgi:hypothetical protein